MKNVIAAVSLAFLMAASGRLAAQTITYTSLPMPKSMIGFVLNNTTSGTVTLQASAAVNSYTDVTPISTARNTWTKVGDGTTKTMTYQVYKNSSMTQTLFALSQASTSQYSTRLINYNFGAAGSTTLTYYVKLTGTVPTGLSQGTYESTITLHTYKRVGTNAINATNDLLATGVVKLSISVTPAVTLGVLDGLGIATASFPFGTVTGVGQTYNFNIDVAANFRYILSIKSANGSQLRHSTYPTITDALSYTVSFGSLSNATLVANTNTTVATNQDYEGFGGSTGANRHPGTLTLTGVTDRYAGDYSDMLTFTVSYP